MKLFSQLATSCIKTFHCLPLSFSKCQDNLCETLKMISLLLAYILNTYTPRIIVTRYSKYYCSRQYPLRVFFKDTPINIKSSTFSFMTTPRISRQSRTKVVEKVVQLNSIGAAFIQLLLMFNKNSFSSPKYPPSPLFNVGI